MSTDTSVPHPRLSGLDAADSALFALAAVPYAVVALVMWRTG